MATAVLSRWARRFLLVGVAFLLLSQLGALAGVPRRTEVVLELYGFVLTVAFGKAYSLVPSYFDRTLAWPAAPAGHLPLQTVAVCCLAAAPLAGTPSWLESLGAVSWVAGVAIFVGTVGATIASNPLGRETGTSEANRERTTLDRIANPFMPVAGLYLLAGSYELVAAAVGLPTLLDGSPVRVSHLVAAGFALLLLFAVGYRLLPRFLVATPPRVLASVVLPAGAIGPALLAVGYPGGRLFVAGAIVEALAISGFALTYLWLFVGTDRDRIGFYGPLFGVLAGLAGVALGLWFATVEITADLAIAHWRLNVLGLLGLSIAGVLYQFYPPGVSVWPLAGDRFALTTLVVYAAGVACLGLVPVTTPPVDTAGHAAIVLAAVGIEYSLAGAIWTRSSGG